jgi:hypothetical protein
MTLLRIKPLKRWKSCGSGLLRLGLPAMKRATSELTPQQVLADLFGSADFPAEVLDPERAAEIVIQRLIDAGFEIKGQLDHG